MRVALSKGRFNKLDVLTAEPDGANIRAGLEDAVAANFP